MLSRICEEFGCTPSVAAQEPYELMLTIMDLRAYAAAKQYVDEMPLDRLKMSPMVELVMEHKAEQMMERAEMRKNGSG